MRGKGLTQPWAQDVRLFTSLKDSGKLWLIPSFASPLQGATPVARQSWLHGIFGMDKLRPCAGRTNCRGASGEIRYAADLWRAPRRPWRTLCRLRSSLQKFFAWLLNW